MKRFLSTAAGVCAFVALKVAMSMGGIWGGPSSSAVEWGVGAILVGVVIFLLSPWLETWCKQRRAARTRDLAEGFVSIGPNE
jgi:hypothetical protein